MLVAVFIFSAVTSLIQAGITVHKSVDGSQTVHVFSVAAMASDVIACGLALFGVARLHASRLEAYHWFERALLQTVFVTGVFAFLQSQFGAAVGLLINIAVLLTVRVMISAGVRLSHLRHEPVTPAEVAPAQASPSSSLTSRLAG